MVRKLFALFTMLVLFMLGVIPVLAQEATAEATMEPAMAGTEDPLAYVRIAHFSPDAPNVDLYINGELTGGADVAYGTVSDWVAVQANTPLQINVSEAGTTADNTAVTPMEVTLNGGSWTTLAALGSVANGTLMVYPIQHDYSEVLPGTNRVTFLNAVEGSPLYNLNRSGVMYTQMGYPGSEFDTGAFQIQDDAGDFDLSLASSEDETTPLVELPATALEEGTYYLVAAVGSADAPELVIIPTTGADIALASGRMEEPGGVLQALEADERFSTLVSAIEAAGLSETLMGEGPFTIFAPTNDFIDANPDVQAAMGNPEALAALLMNHVVQGRYLSQDIAEATSLPTLQGGELAITAGETINVGGADVIIVNIPATNGVIHGINGLLIPSGIQ